jgi:hypothetical protein
VASNPQQPSDSRSSLWIELLATLQSARECLGEKIEDEVRVRADATAQISPNQREATLIQKRKLLRVITNQ